MRRLVIAFLALAWGAAAQTPMALDPATFDKYRGFYQFGVRAAEVSQDGGHFYVQLTNQPKVEIFAETPTHFFLKVVAAQIDFNTDATGAVNSLTLHQNGHDATLTRITAAQAQALAARPVGHPMPVTWPQKFVTPRLLTKSAAQVFDVWPCFSPDGKTIVFSRSTNNGESWTLYKVATTGGDAVPFAQLPINATRCNWSAQDEIALTGWGADKRTGLWLMKGDGSGLHEVTTAGLPQEPVYPSWTGDGKALVMMDGKTLTVQRLDVAAGTVSAVTDRAQVFSGMPSVSPDGKAVAFAGQTNKGQKYDQEENAIWIAEGGAAHPLETPALQGRAPVWSPDGKRIAFESDRGNDKGHYAVYLINRDGTGLVQVTDFALDATHPVFSRDGKTIVFSHGGYMSGIGVADLP